MLPEQELLKNTAYMKNDVYEATNELYMDYKCELKNVLSKLKAIPSNASPMLPNTSTSKSSHVKLPKITIPTFSGKYEEWTGFRDLFISLIHKNKDIDDIQKLHYLKAHLSGEAEQLLRHIPISSESYVQCWTQRHHSLLHQKGDSQANEGKETASGQTVAQVHTQNVSTIEPTPGTSVSNHFVNEVSQHGLLATAVVRARAWEKEESHLIRALIDPGSEVSFVSSATVQLLGLKQTPAKVSVTGLRGQLITVLKSIVQITISSRSDTNSAIEVTAFVVDKVTSNQPSTKVSITSWPELQTVELADPEYHTPNKIDMLLGAKVYARIIQPGLFKSPQETTVAQKTSLGWILCGETGLQANVSCKLVSLHTQVDQLLRSFWELESEPSNKQRILTPEEQRCEEIYEATTTRDEAGRYVVRLPFRDQQPTCVDGGSREIALRRFHSLERRLQNDERLETEYTKVFHEYRDLNHMEPLTEQESKEKGLYLPYHAVVRDERETTKVRIVFDASCKDTNGVSLNNDLMVGPTLQPELRHLIMRWRMHPIVFIADIVKMYRQVLVDKRDTKYQRILWRENNKESVKEYKLNRVTFGVSSAPYLAVKTLIQVALDEGADFPLAASRIRKDFYMDDLMSGCESEQEAIEIYHQMKTILSKGGFELQKWSSNSKAMLEEIQESIARKEEHKKIEIKQEEKLWLAGIEWDQELPSPLLEEWLSYRESLSQLTKFRLPRWTNHSADAALVELHGFSDASNAAYAAVVYLRVIDAEGLIHVSLVSCKTKVSPIKQISIPRLELCGAVLLAKLLVEVSDVLEVDKTNIHAWTDSEVVLAWLSSHPSRWKTFIGNRCSEILTATSRSQWSHVRSEQNPADCASRGISASELGNFELWLNGPAWLKQDVINYKASKSVSTQLEERKVHTHLETVITSSDSEDPLWSKYSSLTKLLRVVAYCRRFLKNKRKSHTYLLKSEIEEALAIMVKKNQQQAYAEEIEEIKKGRLKKKSPLTSFTPFLDDLEIIRVGGRLQSADMTYDQKHPMLLPKSAWLTPLILQDAHVKTLHGGAPLMVNYIRAKFCIPGLKNLVKNHVRKCIPCVRNAANIRNQLMGQLPSPRVNVTRPFLRSGVDYAGPINIRVSKGRGNKSYKGYICLFVCMATKAVHIEAVSELSTAGFLAAFKRFVARRGYCSDLYSDNGSNFVGAAKELQYLFNAEKSSLIPELADWMASNGTQWHFIPPYAPNFGGLWEAGIKSCKFHLKRVIGNATLTFEEISTVLSQIEACMNSRPLWRIDDNGESLPLTPGHFLVGESLVVAPD
ncbi:uncharacterized protein LOC125238968 [Leguminivora glycinivorella]|uniref:uncharacterized protein LOC125238968 n=1 Tax=Leguminivora glycinivorella TaxID=1035111 RepID=UPI00200F4B36|nr:uncharacterized protein LOC125238968 [Leguminivora glycinivorella]